MLALEVLLEVWDVTGTPIAPRYLSLERAPLNALSMHPFAALRVGDGFFVFQVLRYRFKGWVNQILVPYFFFFATSCVVALYSIGVKVKVGVHRQLRMAC